MVSRKWKVGLVSDTHGWFDPALREVFGGCHHIVHAGDVGDASVIADLEDVAPVTVVRGNIDGGPLRFLPLEAVVDVGGVRIASLHIAGSPTRPRPAALSLLGRERPDVLVVGHSHVALVGRVAGALWVNPGAAGRQGFHTERLAALLHIDPDTKELSLERVYLGARSAALGPG